MTIQKRSEKNHNDDDTSDKKTNTKGSESKKDDSKDMKAKTSEKGVTADTVKTGEDNKPTESGKQSSSRTDTQMEGDAKLAGEDKSAPKDEFERQEQEIQKNQGEEVKAVANAADRDVTGKLEQEVAENAPMNTAHMPGAPKKRLEDKPVNYRPEDHKAALTQTHVGDVDKIDDYGHNTAHDAGDKTVVHRRVEKAAEAPDRTIVTGSEGGKVA